MRNLHRLPPLLWALLLVGFLAVLASLTVGTWTYWLPVGTQGFIARRGQALTEPLNTLGVALILPPLVYLARHGSQASRPPHWLDRWPAQILAAVVPAALPAVALAIVLLAPPNSSLFMARLPLNDLSAWVLIAAVIAALVLMVQ